MSKGQRTGKICPVSCQKLKDRLCFQIRKATKSDSGLIRCTSQEDKGEGKKASCRFVERYNITVDQHPRRNYILKTNANDAQCSETI